jgi:hypothetical protein
VHGIEDGLLYRRGKDLGLTKEVAQRIGFLADPDMCGIELPPDDDDDKCQEHSIQDRQPLINVAGHIMMWPEARVRCAGSHQQQADDGQKHGETDDEHRQYGDRQAQ